MVFLDGCPWFTDNGGKVNREGDYPAGSKNPKGIQRRACHGPTVVGVVQRQATRLV